MNYSLGRQVKSQSDRVRVYVSVIFDRFITWYAGMHLEEGRGRGDAQSWDCISYFNNSKSFNIIIKV